MNLNEDYKYESSTRKIRGLYYYVFEFNVLHVNLYILVLCYLVLNHSYIRISPSVFQIIKTFHHVLYIESISTFFPHSSLNPFSMAIHSLNIPPQQRNMHTLTEGRCLVSRYVHKT